MRRAMRSGLPGLAASQHLSAETRRRPIGLRARALSGLVLAPIALALAVAGGIPFALCLAICSVLVFREWDRLVAAPGFAPLVGNPTVRLSLFSFGVLAIAAALTWSQPWLFVPAIALAPLALGRNGGWVTLGLFYAILPAAGLILLRADADHGVVAVIFIFVIVWLTDISAYTTGSLLGGAKLAPRISPGKTWSGAIGGVAAAGIAAMIASFAGVLPADAVTVLLLALALALTAQFGDLFESWVKRRFGVKDSGRLIPGHGGAMDRLDSLIPAAVAASVVGLARGGGDAAATGLLVW